MKQKLTSEQVKVYEEISGFETTGEVYLEMMEPAIYDIYIGLFEPKPDGS